MTVMMQFVPMLMPNTSGATKTSVARTNLVPSPPLRAGGTHSSLPLWSCDYKGSRKERTTKEAQASALHNQYHDSCDSACDCDPMAFCIVYLLYLHLRALTIDQFGNAATTTTQPDAAAVPLLTLTCIRTHV